MSKTRIKRGTKDVWFSSFYNNLLVSLTGKNFHDVIARIPKEHLEKYVLRKIKRGEFKIVGKGTKYPVVELIDKKEEKEVINQRIIMPPMDLAEVKKY